VGTIVTSFDVQAEEARIEIFGSAGTLILPDPNRFGGKLVLRPTGAGEAQIIEPSWGFTHESRGIGVVDLAAALATGRPHRASDELAFHALDVMLGFQQSSQQNRHHEPESTCERPAPLTEARVLDEERVAARGASDLLAQVAGEPLRDELVDGFVAQRLEPKRHRPGGAALGELRTRDAEQQDR
jgi:hypothetical protein